MNRATSRSPTRGGTTLRCVMILLVGAFAVGLGAAASLEAQVAPALSPPGDSLPGTPPPIDISPGGAFLRAALFPGWGHAAIGSYTRGGFYFGAQAATLYTLLRTRTRIGTVQDRVRLMEQVVLTELSSAGITDPEAVQEALDDDGRVNRVRRLLDSRKEQQEDLIALSIFLVLLSAADAYVSAHLARFPDPLELETNVTGAGLVEIGFRVPLPN